MEEKKWRPTLETLVDTTEVDAAIEKIERLNSLCQELNVKELLSIAQQTKEQLKEIDIKQFAGKLTDHLNRCLLGESSHDFGEQWENKERDAIECMAQHIRTFLLQSWEGRKADYGEPCESCKKIKECNFDWLSIMDPLLKKSNVKINAVRKAQQDIRDSGHTDLDQDKGSGPNTDRSNSPSCIQES